MSTEAIIHLAPTVIMAAVGAMVVLLKWGVRGGSALAEYQELGRKVDALGVRMDKAGVEASRLATAVTGMPERLRGDFLPRAEAKLIIEESQKDRVSLHHEVERLWEAMLRDPRARTRSGE